MVLSSDNMQKGTDHKRKKFFLHSRITLQKWLIIIHWFNLVMVAEEEAES